MNTSAVRNISERPVIELRHVSKRFVKKLDIAAKFVNLFGAKMSEEIVHAVDAVNLGVREREVLGLVGESGCGKSTIGRIVAGIFPPDDGKVFYKAHDRTTLTGKDAKEAKLKIQIVFQDPLASLNPRMRVIGLIGQAPLFHGLIKGYELNDYVDECMTRVGLDPSFKQRYPHQFSGGQCQRICIARALAVQPEFLVCDEAVAALDVSIRSQVLNLFMQLRQDLNLTYLFISHDLSVVEHISDRVAVMYLGRIVETAPAEVLFSMPNHPYTQALLDGVPRLDIRKHRFVHIQGEIPSPLNPPPGCHFHQRCPHAMAKCRNEVPKLKEVGGEHFSACHLNEE